MEDSENKKKLLEMFRDRHAEWAYETWSYIRDYGPEKWTEGYVLSHQDKLDQLDSLIEHFEGEEEYEICQYLLAIKETTNKNKYML
jgi:hypothetical protein|tara:strand:+ start:1553 stop:1810 length:258 start_codon:yes stop_codon:yes gene_type:complete